MNEKRGGRNGHPLVAPLAEAERLGGRCYDRNRNNAMGDEPVLSNVT